LENIKVVAKLLPSNEKEYNNMVLLLNVHNKRVWVGIEKLFYYLPKPL
jgi:hypothetical protein